jgi:hypothetical protein
MISREARAELERLFAEQSRPVGDYARALFRA